MPHQCTNCGRRFPDGSKEMLAGCPDCGGNKFQFTPKRSDRAEQSKRSGDAATDPDRQSRSPDSGPSPSNESSAGASTEADRGGPGGRARFADDGDRSRPSTDGADARRSRTSPGEFSEWPETARRPEDREGSTSQRAADRSASARRDPDRSPSRGRDADRRPPTSGTERSPAGEPESENDAQADARSEVVSSDELPSRSERSGGPDVAGGPGVAPERGRVVSEPSSDERPSIDQLREELNDQFESIKIVRPGEYELNLMELYDREEYIVSLQEDGRYVIDVPESWRGGE
ncbi:OapC/ArvC family zinc-ribbon domain-containing protein [Salinilacihabitans rarus]|uniref:OapC/ArvC family zinc-ribbon domain-containing protein n=1 Tax=Salinilacihabitans rarus TaxID=2961596 RepID=UPI0020C8437F|nr:Zn-ribbon containing protein [Salinilacihabitans rarus]